MNTPHTPSATPRTSIKGLFRFVPLLLAFTPLTSESVDTLVSASLDGSLTWDRSTGGAGGFAYLTATFVPTASGGYSFINTASSLSGSNDPFLYVFRDAFDPSLDPFTNPNLIASDDDTGGNFLFRVNNLSLNSGTSYILVPTVYQQGSLGSYDITISGPAAVTLTIAGATTAPPPSAGSDITGGGPFNSSDLGSTLNPAFDGGTLKVSGGAPVTQAFTVTGMGATIDSSGNSAVFSGTISNLVPATAGSLTITNSVAGGSVSLSGVNTYTGATNVLSGAVLALSGNGSIAASSGVVANGTFDVSATTAGASIKSLSGVGQVVLGAQQITVSEASGTFSGDISGSGSVAVTGGVQVLSGMNTYTGGTRISAGTLQVGSGGTSGSIVGDVSADGTLSFNRSDTVVFAGSLSGSGNVQQSGTGKTVLTGDSSFSGVVTVQSGTLSVNGSLANASGFQVGSGATLGGSGTVASVTVQAGGKLAPGNSVATLSSAGDLLLAVGATTVIEIDDTAADRFNATGSAVIAGTLQVVPFGNMTPFPVGTGHTIVGANMGVTGAFDSVTQPVTGILAGTRFDVVYQSAAVQLYVTPASYTDLTSSGISLNAVQTSVGSALNTVRAASGTRLTGNAAVLFNGLYPLNAPQVAVALNRLSGEVHTAVGPLADRSSGLFLNAMLDPFEAQGETNRVRSSAVVDGGSLSAGVRREAGSASASGSPFSLWGASFAGGGHVDGSAAVGTSRRSTDVVGGVAGVSMALGPQTVVGIGAGDSDVNASLANGLGSVSANVFHAGAYGKSRLGDVTFGAAVGYSLMGVETTRDMSQLGLSSLKAKYDVPVWSGRLRVAYEGLALSGFTISPYSLIQASQARIPSFSEKDAASGTDSGISSSSRSASTAQTELGVRLTRGGKIAGLGVTGVLQTGWVHHLKEDTDLEASFTGLPGAVFTSKGARNGKDMARVSAGFELQLTRRTTFGSQVEVSTSSNSSAVSGLARIQYAF